MIGAWGGSNPPIGFTSLHPISYHSQGASATVSPFLMEIKMNYDLTTPKGVVAKMKSTKNSEEWNNACDEVKKANGDYPSFWFKEIIQAGVKPEGAPEDFLDLKMQQL